MKTRIEISRSTVINVGSYNTIKPSVSICIEDVPVEQLEEKTKIVQNLVDTLWLLEILNTNDEVKTIIDIGYNEYVNALETKRDDIKELTKKLYKMLQIKKESV